MDSTTLNPKQSCHTAHYETVWLVLQAYAIGQVLAEVQVRLQAAWATVCTGSSSSILTAPTSCSTQVLKLLN